ncbi:MAG: hypothetical protein FWC53_02190 [Firmicutes bacterium]|nr:hypothetical protein [Bacillota bacterium]
MASDPYKRNPTDSNSDDDEIRARTDYGMLILLYRQGSKRAEMLLQIIDGEVDKRKSVLAAEYKTLAKQEGVEPTYDGMMAYIYNHLDISKVRNELVQQIIPNEIPELRIEIDVTKQKLEEDDKSREPSSAKKSEENDKDKKKEKEEDRKPDDVPTQRNFITNPASKKEKVELAKRAQPDLKKIMEDNSPVASALVTEIENTDAKRVINMSTHEAGNFLVSVINSLARGGKSYDQSRRILATITYVDRQYGHLLSADQKMELAKPLAEYILFYKAINTSIIGKVNIKNCSEILEKFQAHFDSSKTKKEKALYDFRNFSREEQYCWFILGYINELVNSVNSEDQNKGYLMRKDLYESGLLGDTSIDSQESTMESVDTPKAVIEEKTLNLQSLRNQQSRLEILETTPINELSPTAISILDQEHPGYRDNLASENELAYIITPIDHIHSSEGASEESSGSSGSITPLVSNELTGLTSLITEPEEVLSKNNMLRCD